MGYLEIQNLYKNNDIMLFRECYALEKIHGTSAHLSWRGPTTLIDQYEKQVGALEPRLSYFAGGGKHDTFVALFDEKKLKEGFAATGLAQVAVYGESYGGKQQGMKTTYGEKGRFVAFDVKVGDCWLAVPQAEEIVKSLGLEFVFYTKIPTTPGAIDAERDRPSTQARRNADADGRAPDGPKRSEGVVLRPLIEVTKNNGKRIIAKHKHPEFGETKTDRPTPGLDPVKLAVLTEATRIADEWVVPVRLQHVLQILGATGTPATEMRDTGRVATAMLEDVKKESGGEIVWSKEAEKAVGRAAATLFKQWISRVPAP